MALVVKYAKAQGLFRTAASPDPVFTETLTLNLGDVVPSLAGPKRPEGRVALPAVAEGFAAAVQARVRLGVHRVYEVLDARRPDAGRVVLRRDPQISGPDLGSELACEEDGRDRTATSEVEHARPRLDRQHLGQRLEQPQRVGAHLVLVHPVGVVRVGPHIARMEQRVVGSEHEQTLADRSHATCDDFVRAHRRGRRTRLQRCNQRT